MYNHVADYGYFVRKNRLNGLKMWLVLKDTLSSVFGKKTYRWNVKSSQIEGEYKMLGAKYIGHEEMTDDMDLHRWEKEHFLVQHIRILHESPKPTVVKILQVAYNTGQLRCEMELSEDFYAEWIDRVVDYPSREDPLKISDLTTINRYVSRDIQNTPIIKFVDDINAAQGIALAGDILASVMQSAMTETDTSDEMLPMSGGYVRPPVGHSAHTFKIDFSNIKYM